LTVKSLVGLHAYRKWQQEVDAGSATGEMAILLQRSVAQVSGQDEGTSFMIAAIRYALRRRSGMRALTDSAA
jgi:hypothetical protein